MRDAGVVRMLLELRLQDRDCPHIRGIGLVRLRLGARDVERGEDLRLVIVRIFRRERLEGLRSGELPRLLRAIGPVLVIRGDRFHVVALALGLRRRATRIVDRGLCLLRAVGRSARARKRVRHQDRRVAPGGHGTPGVLRENVRERLLGERCTRRNAAWRPPARRSAGRRLRTRWGRRPFRACRPALHPRGHGQRGMRPAGKIAETAKARRLALMWNLSGETDGYGIIEPFEIGVPLSCRAYPHMKTTAEVTDISPYPGERLFTLLVRPFDLPRLASSVFDPGKMVNFSQEGNAFASGRGPMSRTWVEARARLRTSRSARARLSPSRPGRPRHRDFLIFESRIFDANVDSRALEHQPEHVSAAIRGRDAAEFETHDHAAQGRFVQRDPATHVPQECGVQVVALPAPSSADPRPQPLDDLHWNSFPASVRHSGGPCPLESGLIVITPAASS